MRFSIAIILFSVMGSTFYLSATCLSEDDPKPVPQDRRSMLAALEKLKSRAPRLAMPEEAVRRLQAESSDPIVNNAMLRRLYLPEGFQAASRRQPDPSMTLDSNLGVELFWIVSRVNNCHYCLGHQEAKLAKAGLPESRLAKLDTDWSDFTREEKFAYEFTRKLTDSPQLVTDEDVRELKDLFGEAKALEIIFLVARYNSTNRWTDSTGIPQEDYRSFQSSLGEDELNRPSIVAIDRASDRPKPLGRDEWKLAMAQLAKRTCLFPLADPQVVASWSESEAASIPSHYRLLASFPVAGRSVVQQLQAVTKESRLPRHLPAVIHWVASRQDGAMYMQKVAYDELRELGWSEDAIFSLDDGSELPDSKLRSVVGFSKKLTNQPQRIADSDIQALMADYSPQQTAEIIFHVGMIAFLDRLTESARLEF